jgi:hypothetical protein
LQNFGEAYLRLFAYECLPISPLFSGVLKIAGVKIMPADNF